MKQTHRHHDVQVGARQLHQASPDGRRLATASRGKAARIWALDVESDSD